MTAEVDAYFAALPAQSREPLERLWAIIRSEVPEPTEAISYGLPTVKHRGRNVIAIGGWKSHIAIYPMSVAVLESHSAELAGYALSKGTIRIPLGKEFPEPLLRQMVAERLAENAARSPTRKR
jgi:uncharacterized protein YdhG (YjbR/CyaY superfamily)